MYSLVSKNNKEIKKAKGVIISVVGSIVSIKESLVV